MINFFVSLLFVFGINTSVQARSLTTTPAEILVNQADAIIIARIENIKFKTTHCSRLTIGQLTPLKYLKGKLPNSVHLELVYTIPMSTLDCKNTVPSISYQLRQPPRNGMTVVVTVKRVDLDNPYKVTAALPMRMANRIKAWQALQH